MREKCPREAPPKGGTAELRLSFPHFDKVFRNHGTSSRSRFSPVLKLHDFKLRRTLCGTSQTSKNPVFFDKVRGKGCRCSFPRTFFSQADWAIKNLAPGTSTKNLVNVSNWTSQLHWGTTVDSSHYSPLLLSSVKCLMASLKFFASCDRGTTGYHLGLISTQKRRCFSAGFPKLHPYWPRNIINHYQAS